MIQDDSMSMNDKNEITNKYFPQSAFDETDV